MSRPSRPPIGLTLTRATKMVSRAFDQTLADAGGSLPVWLILMSLKTRAHANQRELAATVGIQGATLTHHLNVMEADGLITRARDPENRRMHIVRLTDSGEAMFLRLAQAAKEYDARLRAGLSDQEVAQLEALLQRLEHNVMPHEDGGHPAAIAADPGGPTAH
jgi:MarR family transcriptional regulator for hemolysin